MLCPLWLCMMCLFIGCVDLCLVLVFFLLFRHSDCECRFLLPDLCFFGKDLENLMKEQHQENVKTLANLDAVLRQKVSQDRAELEKLEKQFQEMASSGPKGAPAPATHFDVSTAGGSPVKAAAAAAAATKDADEE